MTTTAEGSTTTEGTIHNLHKIYPTGFRNCLGDRETNASIIAMQNWSRIGVDNV